MKVGLVSEYYPPFVAGGGEWSTKLLAEELAQQPAIERVVVITPNYGAAPTEGEGNLLIERFPFPLKLGNRRILPYGQLANPLFYLYSAWHIVRLARKHKLDLLHVQSKQSVVGGVWAARWKKIPVVVTLRDVMLLCRFGMCLNHYNSQPHGCDRATYYEKCLPEYQTLYLPNLSPLRSLLFRVMTVYHRLDSQLKGRTLRSADALVTISNKLGEILYSRGVTPAQMLTIYNPMPQEQEPQNQVEPITRDNHLDCWRIFFAGRLSWGKGSHLLVEAMPAIVAMLAPQAVELTIAGEGPLRQLLLDRVAVLGLADSVRLLGSVPNAQMASYYANADVVAVPSVVQEGFGRVAMEALVAGTPVVASTHGGLPEIVEEGVTGYVVDPQPELLSDAIVKVLRDEGAFRERVKQALPRLLKKFGVDVSAAHVALYESLIGDAKVALSQAGNDSR